jgi:hypothetical protein
MNNNELNYDFIPFGDDGIHLSFILATYSTNFDGDVYAVLLLNRERMLFQIAEYLSENSDNPQLWHIIDEQEDLKMIIRSFDNYCRSEGYKIIFNGLPSDLSIPELI